MQPEKTTKEIPESFYGSNFLLVRMPKLSYRAYCAARDDWLSKIEAPQNKRILDVGCSTGEALQGWTAKNWIVGLDYEENILDTARELGFQPVAADMFKLPFADESFDAIAGFGIIGSARDPRDHMRRFHRLLVPGGKIYMIVAVYGGIRRITRPIVNLAGVKNQMVTIPTLREFEDQISECGFKIESLATSPLYPFSNVTFSPSRISRTTAVYAFITARKIL